MGMACLGNLMISMSSPLAFEGMRLHLQTPDSPSCRVAASSNKALHRAASAPVCFNVSAMRLLHLRILTWEVG